MRRVCVVDPRRDLDWSLGYARQVRKVFISYRRADSEADAGRLYSDLAVEFGAQRIFKDVDNVPLGADVRASIHSAIADSGVLVVVVGPDWDPRRLHGESDWVRLEIETALEQRVSILPIRVRRAELPEPSQVPTSMRPFCDLNAAELEHGSWRRDLEPVIRAIRGMVADESSSLPPPGPPKNRNPVSEGEQPDSKSDRSLWSRLSDALSAPPGWSPPPGL